MGKAVGSSCRVQAANGCDLDCRGGFVDGERGSVDGERGSVVDTLWRQDHLD